MQRTCDDDLAETPGGDHGDVADPFTDRSVYPLTVVTTLTEDGELAGCLVGFVTQCSIEPPRFLVCVSKANHTYDAVMRASVLGLHLLGREQGATASLFGELSGDDVDKFADTAWHPGVLGVPVLDDCAAWLALGIIQRIDVGDHVALLTYPVVGGAGRRDGVLTNRNAPPLEAGHPAA